MEGRRRNLADEEEEAADGDSCAGKRDVDAVAHGRGRKGTFDWRHRRGPRWRDRSWVRGRVRNLHSEKSSGRKAETFCSLLFFLVPENFLPVWYCQVGLL